MKKVIHFPLLLALTFSVVTACAQKTKASFVTLSPAQFEEKLHSSGENILIDVRTADEYREGHIRNAVQIDVNGADFKSEIAKLDKSKPVLLYCAAGVRSEKAAKILLKEGFTNVFHLEGGITQWQEEKKTVVKD